jgi:hypothetical protein
MIFVVIVRSKDHSTNVCDDPSMLLNDLAFHRTHDRLIPQQAASPLVHCAQNSNQLISL